MRSWSVVVVLLFALSVTGCMFHGNTPTAEAPESFTVENTVNPEKNLPENPWWKEVGSKELDQLVVEALENNKQISIASKNIEIAQSSLDTVKLGWLPSLNLMSGQLQSNGVVLLPNLPVPLVGTGSFFAFLPTWMVNVIQLPNKTKEAEKNVEITVADYLAMRASIAAQVVSSYALLLASIEEENILNVLKSNLNAQFKTARAMAQQGLQTEISINEQDSQLQKIEAQIAINRANKIAAKNALLTLVGRPLSHFTPSDRFSALNLDYIAPGNTPTSVLASRPDVAAARAKIQATDYGISATASLFAPTPMWMGASLSATLNAGGTSQLLTETVGMGLLTWTLDPQYIGKIITANKQYDRVIINYFSVVENAIKEVDNALADFEAKKISLIKQEKTLANSNKNLSTFRAMFQKGLLSHSQYLQSVGQFDQANMAIVQTKLQTIISLSKLYQSMGGGATYEQQDYRLKDQSIVGIDRDDTQK
jgi:outer membrane protein TolC